MAPAAGITLVSTMANISKYSLAQLAHFEGKEVTATPRGTELIVRQAEGMRKVADRWAELASRIGETPVRDAPCVASRVQLSRLQKELCHVSSTARQVPH